MKFKLIKNCKFYRSNSLIENENILIDEEKIIKTGRDIAVTVEPQVIDAQGKLITPGFIDLQVNGGDDVFFNNNVDVNSIMKIYNAHSKTGTQFILITLITSKLNIIRKALQVVAQAMKDNPGILGLHLEGPFLSREKPGAHNPDLIHPPSDEEIDMIITEGRGILKMITIAPEVFTQQQIRKLIDNGIVVSAGHSNATYEEAKAAIDAGMNCITHLYNAMSPFLSKAPGLVGAAFTLDVYAGIIVDGLHSHYNAVDVAYRLKRDKLFLVSDASFTGIENREELFLEGIKVSINEGRIYTEEGSLAGASITLADAVRNCVKKVSINEAEAIKMATQIPAKVIGMEKSVGSIQPGFSSKLNIVDEEMNVVRVIN